MAARRFRQPGLFGDQPDRELAGIVNVNNHFEGCAPRTIEGLVHTLQEKAR